MRGSKTLEEFNEAKNQHTSPYIDWVVETAIDLFCLDETYFEKVAFAGADGFDDELNDYFKNASDLHPGLQEKVLPVIHVDYGFEKGLNSAIKQL